MMGVGDKTFLIALAILFVCIIFFAGFFIGNRYGQINALAGRVEYHLVTYPDSTRTWEPIK